MPAIAPDHIPERLYPVIEALCATGVDVARTIARGPLGQSLAEGVGENTGGAQQKALDVMAAAAFEKALDLSAQPYPLSALLLLGQGLGGAGRRRRR